MRSFVWAFVASCAIHTILLCVGLRYAFYLPIGGPHFEHAAKLPNHDTDFGMYMATGNAINSAPGVLPQIAAQADENQAWLTRTSPDATTMTHTTAHPVMEIGDNGGNGGGGFGSPSPQSQQMPRAIAQPPVKVVQQPPQKPQQQKPQVSKTATATNDQTPQGFNTPPVPTPPSKPVPPTIAQAPQRQSNPSPSSSRPPGKPGQRGNAIVAAQPLPGSNADSDPFSDAPQVTLNLRDGSVVAQNGLNMKTVKPQLNETGWFDVGSMQDPSCKWALFLDSDGNPIKAVPIQPTGFRDEVDLPCEEALNQWQATVSDNGHTHAIPHVVIITINFRQ